MSRPGRSSRPPRSWTWSMKQKRNFNRNQQSALREKMLMMRNIKHSIAGSFVLQNFFRTTLICGNGRLMEHFVAHRQSWMIHKLTDKLNVLIASCLKVWFDKLYQLQKSKHLKRNRFTTTGCKIARNFFMLFAQNWKAKMAAWLAPLISGSENKANMKP